MTWSARPWLVEMDCTEAVKMILSADLDRSPLSGVVQEIKNLLISRGNLSVASISRVQNPCVRKPWEGRREDANLS